MTKAERAEQDAATIARWHADGSYQTRLWEALGRKPVTPSE